MRLIVVVIITVVLTLAGNVVYSAEEKKADDEALFEKKCSQCHSADRPKSKIKTSAEWETTVMRMKNVNGCPITDEEAKTIINYLTKKYGKE